MSSRTKKQSSQDIPKVKMQTLLRKTWQEDKTPAYLVEDSNGNALRGYTDLKRALNWCDGQQRHVLYNDAATALEKQNA